MVSNSPGIFFGTTENGGQFKFGTVFELFRQTNGVWELSVEHNFTLSSTDVAYPDASLIFDSTGNLYGTGSYGGLSGGGGVFELTVNQGGTSYTVLHFFNDVAGSDGYNSQSPLMLDASGNLRGTTSNGGSGSCEQVGVVIGCGAIFELTFLAGNSWTESMLYSFNFTSDGNPEGSYGGLFSGANGNLYGTTFGGGTAGVGTVFAFRP